MPFDLALSEHGDLLFAANRDLEYVEGSQLVNQRIINRLRIKRGSWIFNRDSSLGSDLESVLGHSMEQQGDDIPLIIQTALEPMEDEIEIQSIDVVTTVRGVTAIVEYSRIIPDVPAASLTTSTVAIPLSFLTTGTMGLSQEL